MTSKEFDHIREFYGKHYNLQMRGHVWLAPQAARHIPTVSETVKDWARKGKDIYLKPIRMRIDGNSVRIHDIYSGVINIDRKYVKSMLLNNYNF